MIKLVLKYVEDTFALLGYTLLSLLLKTNYNRYMSVLRKNDEKE